MKLSFRHGIVQYQTSGNTPTFLQVINSGQNISLITNNKPTIITISHKTTDYLFQERTNISNAWGPFTGSMDKWLYWDIDLVTGVRTFGSTDIQPITSATQPISPVQDTHWYDTTEKVMKVRQGTIWVEKLRVFSAKYQNSSILQPYPIGSQVGLLTPTFAGFILFDDEEKPIKRFNKGRKSEFIHTESILSSQAQGGFVSFVIQSLLNIVEAYETITEFSLISLIGEKIRLADHNDENKIAVGLVVENVNIGQFTNYLTKGFITNENWNFTQVSGTPLFCGINGEIVINPPQFGFLQKIGHIINNRTIFLNIEQPIYYLNI